MLLLVLLASDAPDPPAAPKVEGVVVTAQRPVVGDLHKGTLAYRPQFFTAMRPASALDMVNWLPGFVFEDTRDMRGLEGSTGNVLIDGKPPTSKTDTLTSVLKRTPADQVDRVDLIVGGAPGIDMHGRNVMANVILKKRDKPLAVMTAASYVDTHGMIAPDLLVTRSDKRDAHASEISLEIQRNIAIYPAFGYGPWVRLDGSGTVALRADQRFQYDGPYATAKGSYEFRLAGGRLKASGMALLTHETLEEDDRLAGGAGRYGFRRSGGYNQLELGLHYERPFGPASLETQGLERYQAQDAAETLNRPPVISKDTIRSHELESVQRAVLRYAKGSTLTLQGEVEHALNDGFNRTQATRDGRPFLVPLGDIDLVEDRWEGGAGLAWKPDGGFSLDAALKAETSRLTSTGDLAIDRRLAYPKPRLALAWSPDKDSQLRLRAEYEVQQIPFSAIVTFNEYQTGQLRNGNADLRPPRAAVGEAVFERHFWSTGDLTLTARYKALEDVLDDIPAVTATGADYEVIANIGLGTETDLIGNLMVPLNRFGLGSSTVRFVVTWQRARVTDPVSGRQRSLSNFPELLQELHFAQDLVRWKINWGVDAFYRGGSTLYRPFGNESVDAWPHVNVFAERRFDRGLTFRVELQNLPGSAPKNIISVFSGLRDRSALLYVDDKRLSVGPLLYLRLRKTL